MTPKEKAKELVEKFTKLEEGEMYIGKAKECALIAVNEIMEFMRMDDEYTKTASNANSKWVHYWIEVKKEIENYSD